jgi:hypothetical protein
MPYGTIKVDNITFTNGGSDQTITVSGIVQSISGSITATGTIQAATIIGTSVVSGATVTGTTANFTSGNFTNISGGTHTITSGVFATGTAAAPSISFTSDPNTGIYSPGADQVAISTNGTGRLFVDASGAIITSSTAWQGAATYQAGGLQIGGTTYAKALLQTGGTSRAEWFFDSADNYLQAKSGSFYIANTTANPIAFYTNGSERLRITSAGLVGVGTSSPSDPLHIAVAGANSANIRLQSGDGRTYNIGSTGSGYGSSGKFIVYDITANAERFCINSSGSVGVGTTVPTELISVNSSPSNAAISIRTGGATFNSVVKFNADDTNYAGIGLENTALVMRCSNSSTPTERARIDSSGRLLVGTSTSIGYGGLLQVVGGDTARPQIHRNLDDEYPAILYISKARGTGVQSVLSGDEIGNVSFVGNDGTQQLGVASIRCFVDGTPGASDMPGRLVFSTTADGASSPTERLRITSTGQVRLAGAGITFNGDTAAANELDDYEEGTFTPVIEGTTTAGTGTYSANGQIGRYVKIGKVVTVWIRLGWTAHTGTGNGAIGALPFTSQAISGGQHPFAATIGYETNYDVAANTVLSAYVEPNGTRIFFAQIGVGTQTGAGSTALDTAASVSVSATYETA